MKFPVFCVELALFMSLVTFQYGFANGTNLCPIIEENGVFNIFYVNDQKLFSIAQISCKYAKENIEDSSIRVCLRSGKWSGENPVCKGSANKDIECPRIDENGIFNIAYANNRNFFSFARISCKDPKQNIEGSSIKVCLPNGEWSGEDPTCNEVADTGNKCPILDDNGTFNIVYVIQRNQVKTALFSCKDPKKIIEGFDLRVCRSTGKWSGENPTCITGSSDTKTWCPMIEENGIFNIVYANYRNFFSSARFSCKDSKQNIEGSSVRICLSNGEWSGETPTCVKKTAAMEIKCPIFPEKGMFNIVYGFERNVAKTARFSCKNPNEIIEGIAVRVCGRSGEWSGNSPACVKDAEIRCPVIDEKGIFNIIYSNEQNVNSIAQFSCKDGNQRIEALDRRECLNTGLWSGDDPICKDIEIRCPLIDENGIFTIVYGNNRKVSSFARLFCKDPNRTIQGRNTRVCRRNGQWSGENPVCSDPEIHCPMLDEKGIFDIAYENEQNVYSIAVFSCKDDNQKIEGLEMRECLNTGEWSGDDPICTDKEIRCPLIDENSIFNIVYSNDRKPPSFARFTCKDLSQTIQGRDNRICRRNGMWSGVNPVCKGPAILCPVIDEKGIYNIIYDNEQNVESIAEFSCKDSNQRIEGRDTRECLYDGQWSGDDPICSGPEIRCPLINEKGIFNIVYTNERKLKSTARFSCKDRNQEIEGRGIRECLNSGQWSGEDPICKAAEFCPKSSSRLLIFDPEKENYRFGDVVTLWCPPGFSVTTGVVRVMCYGDSWSDVLPDCKSDLKL